MKNIMLTIFIFCALETNAQNYLISFEATGASAIVITVKVENLTKGTNLTLNGGDILRLTGATGIDPVYYHKSSDLKIYPNPMTDYSTLEFSPLSAGETVISVCDLSGNCFGKLQIYLECGKQEFKLSGVKKGFYIINVEGNNYRFSGKLFSNGKSAGEMSIERTNTISREAEDKPEIAIRKGIKATVDMAYTTGDRLKFTGISGNYSTVITDIPTQDKTITYTFVPCSDAVNNYYPVVAIGTQLWMAENLKTTRYNNGDLIGTTTPATLDITAENAPKYQWAYDGNETNAAAYGRMYTWYAATDARGVCPSGWHIPTDADWTILTIYSGGEATASAKLKETGLVHWLSPNAGATNATGFTALPGGLRTSDGVFYGIYLGATFWGSTLHIPTNSYGRGMTYDGIDFGYTYGNNEQKSGFSVRCIKD